MHGKSTASSSPPARVTSPTGLDAAGTGLRTAQGPACPTAGGGSGATAIEVPKLAEAKRISWVNLVFGIGTVIGIWAILGVLADVSGSVDVIKGAHWGWVALVFVLAQAREWKISLLGFE